ncbi:MAG: response regulator [Bacteroidetes bacterium]|nr:response regulator [Bacteroidota bacterium]
MTSHGVHTRPARWRTTIRTKLAIAITLLIGMIALLIYLYVPRVLEDRALKAVAARAQSIGQMTAFSAAFGLDFDDAEFIEEAFEVARQNPDLVYLVVTDPGGEVVKAFDQQAATEAVFWEVHHHGKIAKDDALFKSMALISTNDRVIGNLYLGLSLEELRADVLRSRSLIARLSLLLFVVGMGIVFIISTIITGPLSQITRTVEQIAIGDLTLRAQVQSSDEVGHLARAFNQMVERLESAYRDLTTLNEHLVVEKERAEEMARLKTAFLTNMSHEFRTPLTGILGYAQVLNEEVDEDLREFVQFIEESGQRLMNTLNAVLDLAQLVSEEMVLEQKVLNVTREVEQMVRLLQPMAEKKKLSLVVNPQAEEAWTTLDPSCLKHIVNILVGNAIKFTDEGGVTVEVATDEQRVFVKVRDTGVGISEEFLPHLFSEFSQESTGLERKFQGTGLGLAITKRLTELIGGSVSVESKKHRGSTFTVSFPRMEGATPSVPVRPEDAALVRRPHTRPRVLVVDYAREAQSVVQHFLQAAYAVEAVPNAKAALHRAHQQRYDAVLLDINLGDGASGLDVLRALRALPNYAKVPIIAVTAYAVPGDRDRFIEQGFDGYLPKPFLKTSLVDMLEQARSKAAPPRPPRHSTNAFRPAPPNSGVPSA